MYRFDSENVLACNKQTASYTSPMFQVGQICHIMKLHTLHKVIECFCFPPYLLHDYSIKWLTQHIFLASGHRQNKENNSAWCAWICAHIDICWRYRDHAQKKKMFHQQMEDDRCEVFTLCSSAGNFAIKSWDSRNARKSWSYTMLHKRNTNWFCWSMLSLTSLSAVLTEWIEREWSVHGVSRDLQAVATSFWNL